MASFCRMPLEKPPQGSSSRPASPKRSRYALDARPGAALVQLVQLHEEAQVLARAEPLVEAGLLGEQPHHAAQGLAVRAHRRDPSTRASPSEGRSRPREHPHRGRLPRAVGPEQTEHLAGRDRRRTAPPTAVRAPKRLREALDARDAAQSMVTRTNLLLMSRSMTVTILSEPTALLEDAQAVVLHQGPLAARLVREGLELWARSRICFTVLRE